MEIWNRYLDIALAATLSGLATIWLCEQKHREDLARERRRIARLVRDRLKDDGQSALGHIIALNIGGKDFEAF